MAMPWGDGAVVFVSVSGWDGQGDAETRLGVLELLYSDMGHAFALGLDECIEEGAGGALGESSPGVWVT